MHNELKNELFDKLKNGREWPQMKAGDAIMIEVINVNVKCEFVLLILAQRLPNMSSTEPTILKGVVIGKTNRFSDTAVTILNVSWLIICE